MRPNIGYFIGNSVFSIATLCQDKHDVSNGMYSTVDKKRTAMRWTV